MFDSVDLVRQCQKAAGAEVSFASDDELLATTRHLAVARAAFDAAELHVLGELDRRGVCDREFGSTTATWVAHETHADPRTVKGRVQVAAKLHHPLSDVDDALVSGRIGFDHARVLATGANPRVAELVAAEQGDWIRKAADRPFTIWKAELAARVELLDQEGPFDPDRDLARNRLAITTSGPDSISVRGELVGEYAVSFSQLIESHADRLFRRAVADHAECPELPVPRRATLLALALADLVRQGGTVNVDTSHGPAVDLTLVLTAECPDRLETPGGELTLTTKRFLHLCCDPTVTPLAMSIDGVPLNAGRTHRFANRAQRRAMARRDGGCVFPGCNAPVNWCDAHHVIAYDDLGNTDLTNMALLCRHHHGVTHRNGWTMTTTPDQHFTWTTPTGRTLHSQRHRGRPPDH
jgi:hypothetical protein